VHEDNNFALTMNLIINLKMVDSLEWHWSLLEYFSLPCSPSTHASKAGASLRVKRSVLQKSFGFLGLVFWRLGFFSRRKAPLPFPAIFDFESGLFQNEFIVAGIGFKI